MVRNTPVPTSCVEWSLNVDGESKRKFWWHRERSVSIWADSLTLDHIEEPTKLTDDAVWWAYVDYQQRAIHRICVTCRNPERDADGVDMKVCVVCGATGHANCGGCELEEASAGIPSDRRRIAETWGSQGLFFCQGCVAIAGKKSERTSQPQAQRRVGELRLRRVLRRVRTCYREYPESIIAAVEEAARAVLTSDSNERDDELLRKLREAMTAYFQPRNSIDLLKRQKVPSKGGGVGVFAVCDIPKFTIVGVYPGYDDPLSGEQANLGRPSPLYSLVDLNCADCDNSVFDELTGTQTPFFNEPLPTEESNCGWIQEASRPNGRLSVMTVTEVARGSELLIGYGPLYPRSYEYKYDAFAFHPYEERDGASSENEGGILYALWRWLGTDEEEASFVCYVKHEASSDKYYRWQTEDEANENPETS